jgi:hypothetical protein
MMIEIDDDFVDVIVQGALVKDYVYLSKDLETPDKLHPDDAEAYADVVSAIAVLSKWYFVQGQFDKEVKKARKKK